MILCVQNSKAGVCGKETTHVCLERYQVISNSVASEEGWGLGRRGLHLILFCVFLNFEVGKCITCSK